MPSIINSDDGVVSGTSGLKTTGGNDGITTFQQNGTEAARIDASRNFLLGTTSALVAGTGFISAANTFGYRNRIINGAMTFWQRQTSATITAGSTIAAGYSTVDRFYVYCTGANVTAARAAGSGATQYRMQITGAASVTGIGFGQRIEQANSYDLAGSTATLSVDIANSLLTSVTWTAFYANTADTFGTLASPTRTQIATGTFTVNSTVTNYSVNISIPAAATTGIEIVFTVGAQTSGTWTIGNVQLEKGAVETSFDYRPVTTELSLCQRYFEKTYPLDVFPGASTGTAFDNQWRTGYSYSAFAVSGSFKITKRSSPTMTVYAENGVAGQASLSGQANQSCSISGSVNGWNISVNTTGVNVISFYYTAASEL